jgi:hypothetical protein
VLLRSLAKLSGPRENEDYLRVESTCGNLLDMKNRVRKSSRLYVNILFKPASRLTITSYNHPKKNVLASKGRQLKSNKINRTYTGLSANISSTDTT